MSGYNNTTFEIRLPSHFQLYICEVKNGHITTFALVQNDPLSILVNCYHISASHLGIAKMQTNY